jgi:multicomponent K+:H+ antiporter subunit D
VRFFLLVELLERARQVEVGPQQLDDGNDALPAFLDAEPPAGTNLDDNEEALIGRAIPAAWRSWAWPSRSARW